MRLEKSKNICFTFVMNIAKLELKRVKYVSLIK